MTSSAQRLLSRLAAALSASAAISNTLQAEGLSVQSAPPETGSKGFELSRDAGQPVVKLVFGRVRGSRRLLASHGSHSSHSSHSSHYSGTSSYPTYPNAPVPATPLPVTRPLPRISAEVRAKLLKIRSLWPRQVMLTARAYFKVMDHDQVIGIKVKDENAMLPLIDVRKENVIVMVDGSPLPLLLEQCDLVQRLGGEAAILALADDPTLPKVEKPSALPGATPKTSTELADGLLRWTPIVGQWDRKIKLYKWEGVEGEGRSSSPPSCLWSL